MNNFTAWIALQSRNWERHRLNLELIDINNHRSPSPADFKRQVDRVTAIVLRLGALSMADMEARLAANPAPLWPGPMASGARIRPMSFEHAPEFWEFFTLRAKIRLMEEEDAALQDAVSTLAHQKMYKETT